MHSFPLPVSMPMVTISLLWHPRQDADPAHRWLRGCVREVCAEQHTVASNRRTAGGSKGDVAGIYIMVVGF
jgi:hypothetical protein